LIILVICDSSEVSHNPNLVKTLGLKVCLVGMNESVELDAASCVWTHGIIIGHLIPLPVLLNIISITSSFN